VLVPSTAEERADLLDETDWSRRFSWGQISTVARYLRRYQLAAGKALFREGDHDAFLAIVLSGQLEIHKSDLAEQSVVVARVRGRGRMVGEMSLLDGAARSATAIAAESTELLVLTKREFHQLAAECPEMALELTLAIAATIAQLLRQTTGALVEHLGEETAGK
jgi:CRP-like cAMP-binding protein